jgi:hypothetical protein
LTHARLAWCGLTTLVICIQVTLTHLSGGGSLVGSAAAAIVHEKDQNKKTYPSVNICTALNHAAIMVMLLT